MEFSKITELLQTIAIFILWYTHLWYFEHVSILCKNLIVKCWLWSLSNSLQEHFMSIIFHIHLAKYAFTNDLTIARLIKLTLYPCKSMKPCTCNQLLNSNWGNSIFVNDTDQSNVNSVQEVMVYQESRGPKCHQENMWLITLLVFSDKFRQRGRSFKPAVKHDNNL